MEKNVVKIDQKEMDNFATCFGLLCRVCEDHLPKLATSSQSLMVPVFCAAFLGRWLFVSPEGFNAFVSSLVEARMNRCVLKGRKNQVDFPDWDPEDHYEEDCHPLTDVFFSFYAHKLFADGVVELPEQSLGPIFTLSGLALEGIAKGYHLVGDEIKNAYSQYEEMLNGSFSTEGGMEKNLVSSLESLVVIAALQQSK